jgi:hypothetical protein
MNKQTEILRLLKGKKEASFQFIVDNAPFGYYRNAKHYIGQILTTMVRNGKIERVRRGFYKYLKDIPDKKTPFIDKNQKSLF